MNKTVYVFAGQVNSLLLNKQNVLLLLHLFASLCHILNFDAAKFSIKLYTLVYVSVVRQRDEYEIVTETRLIKTT